MITNEFYSYILLATFSVVIFCSLGILVIKQNPTRKISWVFGFICLTFAMYYFTSLFLFPSDNFNPTLIPFALRLKWAFTSFAPALYCHMTGYYFPEKLKKWTNKLLPFLYGVGFLFFLLNILSNTIISESLYRGPLKIIGPVPGKLMPLFLLNFCVFIVLGTAGLIYSYFINKSRLVRHQIQLILVPIAFLILSLVANIILVMTLRGINAPNYIGDTAFLIMGFLFANAVLRYGAVTGRPVFLSDIFRSVLLGSLSIFILFNTSQADLLLANAFGFSFPIATSIAFIIIIFLFPVLWTVIGKWIDNLINRKPIKPIEMLAEIYKVDLNQEPQEIFVELIKNHLQITGAACAIYEKQSSKQLRVNALKGDLELYIDQEIPVTDKRFLEYTYLFSGPIAVQNKQFSDLGIGLIYPIQKNHIQYDWSGCLLLGNHHNGKMFNASDLIKISDLINSYQIFIQNHEFNTTKKGDVLTSIMPSTGLSIQLLGGMQIYRNGLRIEDQEWGGELSRYLLAYLLWKTPLSVSREEICEFLWPESNSNLTANRFHVAIHNLRTILEPALIRGKESQYIVYDGGRYRFNKTSSTCLDIDLFEQWVQSDSPKNWQNAIDIYRGSYLMDMLWQFPIDLEIRRQMIEIKFIETLKKCINYCEPEKRLLNMQKLVAIEPGNQAVQYQLIQSFLNLGMLEQANNAALNWQKALHELDIAPTPQSIKLWEQIRKNSQKINQN